MELGRIAVHLRGLDGNLDRDPLALGFDRRRQIGNHAAEDLTHVAARHLQRLLTRIETRQAQQVLDQPLHARRVPRDDLEELVRAVGIRRLVEQRFHVSANGGERRPQLVRHVGDEVAPDLIGPAQIGDVVQDEHGAAAAGAGDGCGSGHERSARIARQRHLLAADLVAAQRARQLRRDVGMPNHFEIRPAGGRRVHAQHVLRGAIHQLQPSLPIDDEHALDHAGEDRAHPRAIARELFDPSAQLLHRGVERPRDGAELVGPVVVRGSRQIPG